jgi:hypothetical protein
MTTWREYETLADIVSHKQPTEVKHSGSPAVKESSSADYKRNAAKDVYCE